MSEPHSNPVGPNLAPQSHQQMTVVAELRWRLFVNSLRTFHGRLELVSRIFLGIFFVAGGVGGAVGLGGAARTRFWGCIFLRQADHKFALAKKRMPQQASGRRQIGITDYQAQGALYIPEKARFGTLLNLAEGTVDCMDRSVQTVDLEGSRKFVIHTPVRVLGSLLDLKGMNVLCWTMFVTFLVVPLFVNLRVQFKTGSGSIRKFDSDFVYFYGIGHLLNEYPATNLYDYNLQQKIFNQIYPAHEAFYGPSPYPPYVALFFRPFARVSFESAYLLWMGISLALYIAGIAATVKEVFPRERLKISLIFCFALAFYPFVFGTLLNGQLASVAVFSIGLAIFQERHSNPFCGGLALSILAYKPTLLFLLLPMLFLTRRFKTLFGFIFGTVILIVVATAFTGIQIWPAYARMLGHFGHSAGLRDQSALQLWKYIDFVSLSYAIPGGRSTAGVAILICLTSTIASGLAVLLWKSVTGGRSAQYLAWAATLTWTLMVNVYVPIYDSVLVTIAVVLTLGALKDLEWSVATGWITFLSLLIFAVSWKTEVLAKSHGIQLLSIFLAALGLGQLFILYRVNRQYDRSVG